MNTTGDSLFQKLKNRSSLLDENSKKVPKRKSQLSERSGVKMPPSAEPRTLDMKSVKVLVERTKFNEMCIVDRSRNSSKIPLKLVNGRLEKKRGRPLKKKEVASTITSAAITQKPSINEVFRIRKCYVKILKDKLLLRLHAKHAGATLPGEQKRSRGRPKKSEKPLDDFPIVTPLVDPSTFSVPTPPSLKRKNTESEDSSPPKRGRKVNSPKNSEFFIKFPPITTPSPRRKVVTPSPEENKRNVKKPVKKASTHLNLIAMRQKFGSRFFKSYVKVRRIRDPSQMAEHPLESKEKKKKKNGKNLSVSFLETVEIFGESSDGEDWADYEDGSFSGKGSRLKPLENGDTDEDIVKPFVTSTPCGGADSRNSSTSETSSVRKSGGILKRKEKISFSPLKEDEPSPRKEQLKLANEKIVRLSFEQQPPAEEDERETVQKSHQPEPEKKTPAAALAVVKNENNDGVDENESHKSNESVISPTSIEPTIEPPPSAENDERTEEEDSVTNQEQKQSLENEPNLQKGTTPPTIEENNESQDFISEKDKEDEESFESAVETPSNLEENAEREHSPETNEEDTKQNDDLSEKLEVSDAEGDDTEYVKGVTKGDDQGHQHNEDSLESHPKETESASVGVLEKQPIQDDEKEEISEANQVNISNTSEQHFEDASELVATALSDEDRDEAEAVLNDVCQMAAAESGTLLSEDGELETGAVEYDNSHDSGSNDVEDDDFTSVLTHPEVERSLQSAASTLVPNSQEIVVAAAASSQVAGDIDVTEDAFASVVAEVERFTKDVNPEIYSDDVGITGDDVMMDNVQASNSLDDIFDDDVDGQSHMFLQFPDDIISSLRMSSGNIDIGHDKSLPIQVIETEVMAIPNEPDLIFDKPLGTTASILGTPMGTTNDTLSGHGHCSTTETTTKISLGRIFQSVKSYVMSPGGDKNSALQD